MRITRKQALHGHDHTGRTIAALKSLMFEKCLLHRIELAVVGQTFDGDYVSTLGVCGKHETRTDGPSIDQYGARAADTHAAAFHGALEREIVAQAFQQGLIRPDCEFLLCSVNR